MVVSSPETRSANAVRHERCKVAHVRKMAGRLQAADPSALGAR
ncbi:MAG TPA: hypothetical protein VOB72_09160 [Candidatus Dormibacteraeota bacterium]|nr:hypothetical protein [Candidatus Dormibacteraeota bacterium]